MLATQCGMCSAGIRLSKSEEVEPPRRSNYVTSTANDSLPLGQLTQPLASLWGPGQLLLRLLQLPAALPLALLRALPALLPRCRPAAAGLRPRGIGGGC